MKLSLHAVLLALLAIGAALLALEEPQFGDDFSYWTYGFNVHEGGLAAWTDDGFHQLRWPVWGLCWLAQGIFGYGLVSYYFTPFLILVLGSLCAFAIGWKLFQRKSHAWACGILFIFHPLLDANLTRPYPDIGEGILGAGAVFCWWGLMHAATRGRVALTTLGCGLCLFLAEENRLTGVFFIPLLGCLTLLFFHRKFLRLLLPLAVFAVLLGGQMLVYHVRFGDWLHFIHANASAKGRPGTEAVTALWLIPFRFLGSLHKGGDLLPVYAVFGVLGLWFGWKRHGLLGRVIVAWFVLLYLAYACAPQQLWPFRPMLRVADRFLSSLAIPYSILAFFGLLGVLHWLAGLAKTRALVAWLRQHPAGACAAGAVLLAAVSLNPLGNRNLFSLGYVPEMRAYMRALPEGTVVFTHQQVRVLAHMVDAPTARKIHWEATRKWITAPEPETLAMAAKATEFWYIRKLALMRFAKGIITEEDTKKLKSQPPLAPWFDVPEQDWRLNAVLARSDTPEIILYRRRTPTTPPPLILTNTAPEFKDLLPPLPFEWKKKKGERDYHEDALEFDWRLPVTLRGKLVRLEILGSSEDRDAFSVQVAFGAGGKFDPPYLMKPYFFPVTGKDFACLYIPPLTDQCKFRIRFAKGTDWVRVEAFRLVVD